MQSLEHPRGVISQSGKGGYRVLGEGVLCVEVPDFNLFTGVWSARLRSKYGYCDAIELSLLAPIYLGNDCDYILIP